MSKSLKRMATVALASLALMLPVVLLAVPANCAAAQGDVTSDIYEHIDTIGEEAGIETETTLPEMVGSIIRQILTLLGIILVVLIIYAGWLWMSAGGNTDQIDKAKKIIINAVIGLIIIFAAYAITDFVLGAIFSGTGLE
jgi:hypothetical protein